MPRGRRRGEDRVLGPYEHRRGAWRIIVVLSGVRTVETRPTKSGAEKLKCETEEQIQAQGQRTIDEALEVYEQWLRDEGHRGEGNKPGTVKTTMSRLRMFFPVADRAGLLRTLSAKRCRELYDGRREKQTGKVVEAGLVSRAAPRFKKAVAVDTRRNTLAEAKSFLRWCHARKWILANPLEAVKGTGKRKKGVWSKAQLRIDEMRKYDEAGLKHAIEGKEGALAALVALYLGMRASEIISRTVRDLDNNGSVLWIPDAKTPAGRRTVEVPGILQPLVQRQISGKVKEAPLFGYYDGAAKAWLPHRREWVNAWVGRICKLAGVPIVTAHSMRGLHSSKALESGVSPHLVAASLGHANPATTISSYAQPGSVESANAKRLLTVLAGGRKQPG